MTVWLRRVGLLVLLALWLLPGPPHAALRAQSAATPVTYNDVRPMFAALGDALPATLKGLSPHDIEAAWPAWVRTRDREIRGRVSTGDEDSLVNLWLYGTTFTRLPRAIARDMQRAGDGLSPAAIIERRLDDFVTAVASPGEDTRMRFAREILEARGMDPAAAADKERVRGFLRGIRARAQAEFERYTREVATAVRADPDAELPVLATLYRERGLSSDTSLLPDFAIDQALEGIRSQGTLAPGAVRRAAVLGPGLDFVNKADGQTFYPEQITQPFALIDSLTRVGLSSVGDLAVTAFDLSPRVIRHLAAAAERAEAGSPYTLQLRLNGDEQWSGPLARFWEHLGDRIGETATPVEAPVNAGAPRLRAVRVRPAVVRSVVAQDLNIVTERLSLPPEQQFDLIIATNVLVYYDAFEQALALTNVAAMLKPGGVFLSNNLVLRRPETLSWPFHLPLTYSDQQRDHMFLYRRTP